METAEIEECLYLLTYLLKVTSLPIPTCRLHKGFRLKSLAPQSRQRNPVLTLLTLDSIPKGLIYYG